MKLRGQAPTRHQLIQKLLREQPHLRVETLAFREALIIRAIYVVGPDLSLLANFTGFSLKFVTDVRNRRGKDSLKAMRAYVEGHDYEKGIIESIKDVGRTITRAIEKRTLRRKVADYAKKLGMSRRRANA